MNSVVRVVLFGSSVPESLVNDGRSELSGPLHEERASFSWGTSHSILGIAEDIDGLKRRLTRAGSGSCDVVVIGGSLADAPPGLVVSDVDSTLITSEVIEMLAQAAGSEQRVAELTELAMAGELDFTSSLRARVATLSGLPSSVFDEVLRNVELTPGVVELLDDLSQRRIPVGVVSGGFAEVVGPLAAELGLRFWAANSLEVVDGRLTGRTRGAVVDRAAKADHLLDFAQRLGIDPGQVLAVGDGANDLDMLSVAGLGVAFCAKPIAAQHADGAITMPRLDCLSALLPTR